MQESKLNAKGFDSDSFEMDELNLSDPNSDLFDNEEYNIQKEIEQLSLSVSKRAAEKDRELRELYLQQGAILRNVLFFFSFLTLIDSTDKLESEELSLLDCELKFEVNLNCVFLDLYFEIGFFFRKMRKSLPASDSSSSCSSVSFKISKRKSLKKGKSKKYVLSESDSELTSSVSDSDMDSQTQSALQMRHKILTMLSNDILNCNKQFF
jgi:hypothetical protein